MSNTLNNNPFSFDNSNGSNCVTFHGDAPVTNQYEFDEDISNQPVEFKSYGSGSSSCSISTYVDAYGREDYSKSVVTGNDGTMHLLDSKNNNKEIEANLLHYQQQQIQKQNEIDMRNGIPHQGLIEAAQTASISPKLYDIFMHGQIGSALPADKKAEHLDYFKNEMNSIMASPNHNGLSDMALKSLLSFAYDNGIKYKGITYL